MDRFARFVDRVASRLWCRSGRHRTVHFHHMMSTRYSIGGSGPTTVHVHAHLVACNLCLAVVRAVGTPVPYRKEHFWIAEIAAEGCYVERKQKE